MSSLPIFETLDGNKIKDLQADIELLSGTIDGQQERIQELEKQLAESVPNVKPSCCKAYDSTPIKGIYHSPDCKNWVLTD